MHASEMTRETIRQANELYWDSERSVNQIAEELDLSKGALYGVIEPEPSGLGCPLCGDEVVYPNRTAKDRDRLDCPTCDWDGAADETTGYDDSSYRSESGASDIELPAPTDALRGEEEAVDRSEGTPPRPVPRPSATTIAGGALLGAAVGLALVMWARRR